MKAKTILILLILLLCVLLPACQETETLPVETPTLKMQPPTTPPVITIKQELEEQLDMLRALVKAEKGRGKDLSQVESWLDEAEQALQSNDLLPAREKLREAGEALGVELP